MATVADWTVEDVAAWLEQSLRLPYAATFMQANIDGSRLIQLDKEMLLDFGMDDVAHITCLLDHIAVLRIQFERTMKSSEESVRRKLVTRAGSRSMDDGLQHSADARKQSAAVYPRVGSPVLCDMPLNFVNGTRKSENIDAIGQDPSMVRLQWHASGHADMDAAKLEAHRNEDGAQDFASMESGGLLPVASQSSAVSGGISTTCSTAAGSGMDSLAQGKRLATIDPKHQPPRYAAVPSLNKLCPVRASTEALSRSSSAPSARGKRGPSVAAADGASLFLSDQSRGVHFGTTPRDVEVLPQSLGPGPARYDASVAAGKMSARVSVGMPRFNAEPRKTMEGMYMRGWAGPGVGKYNPPLRSRSRGGSFTRASRWGSRSSGGLPGTLPSQSPGPMSYKPNHAALSTVH